MVLYLDHSKFNLFTIHFSSYLEIISLGTFFLFDLFLETRAEILKKNVGILVEMHQKAISKLTDH